MLNGATAWEAADKPACQSH